jgi:peptidoglycan/LPS O-acetylase OafA/YrhL
MHATRIESLDGLRAIAIYAVCAFHYLVRWAPPYHDVSLYPYGSALASTPLAAYGHYGVQLFFVISGFVIALTLQRCGSPLEFAIRRYARLAPAMLVFSVVTFAIVTLVPGSPFEAPSAAFVSTVTFVDPAWLNAAFGTDAFTPMDGAYWSLYVEVQFYLLACLVYFTARERFAAAICALAVIATGFRAIDVPVVSTTSWYLLMPKHLPWFVLGIGFHALAVERRRALGLTVGTIALGLLLVDAAAENSRSAALAAAVIAATFAAALYVPPVRRALAWRPLVAIGAASYGLYLVHQHVGVTLLHALPAERFGSAAAGALAVLGVLTMLTIVAIASFRVLETPCSRLILRALPRSRLPATGAASPAR